MPSFFTIAYCQVANREGGGVQNVITYPKEKLGSKCLFTQSNIFKDCFIISYADFSPIICYIHCE